MDVFQLVSSHEVSIGLCFLLGALHALEPGHGKTAMAIHLLAERSLVRPALAALSTAVSHSISILLIATLVHGVLDLSITEEGGTSLYRYLNLASGLLLSGMGIWLYASQRRKRTLSHSHGPSCGCRHHRSQDLPVLTLPGRKVPKSLNTIILGFAVGLVPCPTALVALSQAIVGHDWITVGTVTLTFSAGIFFGLFVVGGILGTKLAPRLLATSFAKDSPSRFALAQAAVVFATGTWHLYQSLI